jgi:dihydrofolate reductase
MAKRRGKGAMSKLQYAASMSLDGFVAGPDQSLENPLGVGGHLLHEWLRALAAWRKDAGLEGGEVNASTAVYEADDNVGAIIMGRNMFGGGSGPWGDDPWMGWWGDNPPFHMPVFVLTHHPREPLEFPGGTTFTFVSDGIGVALELARRAANGGDVAISGGASSAKQYLAAGLVDEIQIHLVPVFLGEGVRLFEEQALSAITMEQVRSIEAPGVTHLTYRIVR